MADAAPAPPDDLEATYRQLLQTTLQPPPVPTPQGPTPSSQEGRGWLSLLGEALGGGQEYGTPAEREQGGIAALGAMGRRMLEASDYSYNRHSLGSIIGQGMGAATEALGQRQAVSASQAAAAQEYQQKQQEQQLARVKEAVPILTQLQELRKQKALAGLGSPLGGTTPGTTPGTSIGAVGSDTGPINAAGDSATRKAAEGGPPAPGTPAAVVAQQVHDFWISKGFSEPVVAGILAGGPGSESNFDPTASGDKGTSIGLYQHHGERIDNMRKFFNLSGSQMPSADQQNQYAYWEITQGPLKNVGDMLQKAQTPAEAAAIWTQYFGVPKDKTEIGRRALGAGRFAGLYTPKAPPGTTGAVAADGKPVGDPTKPELAPGPPGSTAGGPPVSLGSAIGALSAGKPQYTVNPPPSGKGTPLPAGRLATSEVDPAAVSGNVEAIQAGRQRAQLAMQQPDGGVLAAGPAAGPAAAPTGGFTAGAGAYSTAPTPPAAAAPQASPQAPPQAPPQQPPAVAPQPGAMPRATPESVPDSYEEFRQQHPIVPSDEDRAGFSTAPDAAQLGVLQRQAQIAKYAMDVARTQGDAAGLAKASDAYNTILASENTVRENANKAGADRRAAWFKDQDAQLHAEWMAAQTEKQKRITQQQQADQTFRLKEEEGRQTRLTNKEAVFNQANQKGLEAAQTDQAAARGVVAQLEGFRNISEGVGQPGWLQTTKWPGSDHTVAEQLQQAGIPVADTGGAQLLKGGMINIVKALREGMPMGSLSDRDLSFIERMGPTEWMDPDTRAAAIGYLLQANRAKMGFARDVQKEMSRGKNYGDAVDAVDARSKPFVPQVPADLTAHWKDDSPEWTQRRMEWGQQNDAGPGTLIHMDDGRIVVLKRPPRKDRGQG